MDRFPNLIETFIREKQEAKELKLCVADWLDSASRRASQISIATHVLKFLHSDAKGTNVNAKVGKLEDDQNWPYVTTSSITKIKEDVAGNGAAMDVGRFLQLEVDGVTLIDLITKDDSTPFVKFAENETQLMSWMSGFKTVLIDKKLSSHTLAKQVYFPVEKSKYHLIAPLYATSLSHALYDKIKNDRYSEKAKLVRECKKMKLHSDDVVIDYPNLACQMFGGTKPQNISRLNSLRGGKSYLLRNVPPLWVSLKKPPLKKNAFWQEFNKRSYLILESFRIFLSSIQRIDSNKDRRDQFQKYVDRLIDLLLQFAGEIQSMESGWSLLSEISNSEKVWLDSSREDLANMKELGDWMDDISGYFAKNVLDKLEYKNNNINFTDMNYDYLKNECLDVLNWSS